MDINHNCIKSAFTVATLGSIASVGIYSGRFSDLNWAYHLGTCVCLTVLISGLLIICAVASALLRR